MPSLAIGFLIISTLEAVAPSDTAVLRNEISFHLDSLEVLPLPEIEGLNFGNTILDLHTDTATFDPGSRKIRIVGRVFIRQDQEGISTCTIALGSLKSRQGTLKFSPRFQILTDKEGRFSLTVSVEPGDVLIVSWTGELYRLYRVGNLVR
jgi:hypothetical protein